MKIVAIIQARMGSTRLPGKVMKELAGETVLARVVNRTRRATLLDEVVVATTSAARDDVIVDECRRLGVPCFRGDENDVLDRYYQCARQFHAETIVRITSDCPLIDPQLIDRVVGEFHNSHADYASNGLQASFPVGLGVEVISYDALKHAWRDAAKSYERAHVTLFLYRHPELFAVHSVTSDIDYSDHRWTLDTPEDIMLLEAILARLPDAQIATWHDVLEIVGREPELLSINSHIHQKALEEG
jgi:spore coat polysaccharide biosynthesis protein SpsF